MADLSFFEEARLALEEHLPQLRSDDDFSEDQVEFEEAAGPPVQEKRQASRPFYFSVANTAVPLFPFYTPVVLFNAAVNMTTSNFGNSGIIQITSLLPNITYGGLLSVTIDQPFRMVGLKLYSDNPDPLSQPIAFTDTQYIGDADTESYVPNIALDQIYTASVGVPTKQIINSSKQISFLLLSNSFVNYKVYPKYISDYARALERKKVIKDFTDPHPLVLPSPKLYYF